MISDSADNFVHLVAFFSAGRTELARQTLARHRHRSHPPRASQRRAAHLGLPSFCRRGSPPENRLCQKGSGNAARGFGFFLILPFLFSFMTWEKDRGVLEPRLAGRRGQRGQRRQCRQRSLRSSCHAGADPAAAFVKSKALSSCLSGS